MNQYPETPGSKVAGPSRDAAEAERSRAATLRDQVLLLLAFGDELTADECAAKIGASVLAIRPRLSELVAMNKIQDAGTRRKNASGHSATVWKYVAPAKPLVGVQVEMFSYENNKREEGNAVAA